MGHDLLEEAAANAEAQAQRAERAEAEVRRLRMERWVLRAVCVILALTIAIIA